jgi:glycine cleavage system H lipoate-binding protein/ABC-type phosphate transport system substrate-binding protein
MKTKILFLVCISLVLAGILSSSEAISKSSSDGKTYTVVSSPDLLNLSSSWAREYTRLNPGVKINVVPSGDNGFGELEKGADLGFVSGDFYKVAKGRSFWKEVVGRDVVVPVINASNPLLKEMGKNGISASALAGLLGGTDKMNWKTLVKDAGNLPVRLILVSDENIISGVAAFLKKDREDLRGIRIASGNEVAAAVQKDPYAIGFCRLTDIMDFQKQSILDNLAMMPLDRNGNGKMDSNENIYTDLGTFTRGVWIGKYPKTLYTSIYSVAAAKPGDAGVIAFLRWVLTDGQSLVSPSGYSELTLNERRSKVEGLIAGNIDIQSPAPETPGLKVILAVLSVLVVMGFVFDFAIRYIRSRRAEDLLSAAETGHAFNETRVAALNGLFFDKTHTWAFMEKDGTVRLGIDDFLQHVTGTVTQVKMKNPGERISKGEYLLTIVHKGKQLRINSPVSGIITERNSELLVNASLINTSAYTEGWVYSVEPSYWSREISFLFMADKYRSWVKNEIARLKDFVAEFVQPGTAEFATVVLQDGGELKENFLSDLGPEVWEEFQSNFIDTCN